MLTSRRSFLTGLAGLIAAPAIVRAESLMPVRGIIMPVVPQRDLWRVISVFVSTQHEWSTLTAERVAETVSGPMRISTIITGSVSSYEVGDWITLY